VRILLVEVEKKVSEFVAHAPRADRFAVDLPDHGLQGRELRTCDRDLIILDLLPPRQGPILIPTARDATAEKPRNLGWGRTKPRTPRRGLPAVSSPYQKRMRRPTPYRALSS
jgi:DNA-binding response OmpR family regulator